MDLRRLIALSIGSLLVLAAACTSDGETPSASPSSSALGPPWGLLSTPVPGSQEEIDAVIAAMPDEVEGLTATAQGNEIAYGESGMGEVSGSMETFLRIMTIGGDEFGQGAPFIEAIAETGGLEVEGQDLDPDASIVFLAGLTPAGDVTYASVMWADPSAPYVLLIQGTSPEQRAALVAAYEQAAATALG
jgi:hypothetical protein